MSSQQMILVDARETKPARSEVALIKSNHLTSGDSVEGLLSRA